MSYQAVLRDEPVAVGSDGPWLLFREPRHRLLAQRVDEVRARLAEAERLVESEGLWAVGWLAYEAAPAFDPALVAHEPPPGLPLLQLTLYPEPERLARLPEAEPPEEGGERYRVGEWRPSVSREEFGRAFDTVQQALAAGDSYQVNYTLRLRTDFAGDPYAFFADLARGQRAGHAAFLGDVGDGLSDGRERRWSVACASPELFFHRDGDRVTCRPMKGTAPRGRTSAEDDARAAALAASPKERAENLMIVDMVRNDLGRVARPGTVRPEALFTVERYPTVLQMTSTVSARTDASTEELFAALFPCASITGAPKIRTSELLRELEPEPRGVYTGAVGYLAPGRRARWGVAIRTAVVDGATGRVEYGVGGGIVADSTAEAEWEETRIKARVLRPPAPDFELLETLRWEPAEDLAEDLAGYCLLPEHLARLADSAQYFDFAMDPETVRRELTTFAAELPPVPHRVRLLVERSGRVHREATPLPEEPFVDFSAGVSLDPPTVPLVSLAIASAPVDASDPFLFHKTTHRRVYEEALRQAQQDQQGRESGAQEIVSDIDDVVLWNERGELTESTMYNLLLRLDGEWVTPPVASGLLAGTYRTRLLAEGRVREATVTLDDLRRAEIVALVNSVRGVRRAELVKKPARPREETLEETPVEASGGSPAFLARLAPAPKARL